MDDAAEHCRTLPLGSVAPNSGAMLGRTLGGRYRIEALIGEGAMGTVYRSEHVVLRKVVAVKLLAAAADIGIRERFLQEARVSATLKHPGIAEVYDFGITDDGIPYYAMEYLEGTDLQHRLAASGPLPAPEAIAIAREVAIALAAAHAAGVVHRDLKPANIFLVPQAQGGEVVKVVDFGISKVADSSAAASVSQPTMAGLVSGTPAYMSPEQTAGRAVDSRADIYALGVVLYEMLCGRPPFESAEVVRVLNAQLCESPPPLAKKCPGLVVAAPLEKIVMRALAKDREKRFASMSELDAALVALDPLAASSAAASNTPRSCVGMKVSDDVGPVGPFLRHLNIFIAVSVLALLLVVGAVIWLTTYAQAPAATSPIATPQATADEPQRIPVSATITVAMPEPAPVRVVDAGQPATSPPRQKKSNTSRVSAPVSAKPLQPATTTSTYNLDDLKPYGQKP